MNPLRSIAFKLSLLSSLFVLTVIGLMSRHLLRQAEEALIAQMRVRAEDFARYALPDIFPKVDPFALHSRVAQVKNEKGVVYVAVTDRDDAVLSHSDPRLIGDKLSDPLSVKAQASEAPLLQRFREPSGEEAYDMSVPILIEARAAAAAQPSRRVGTVRIGFNRSSMETALRDTQRDIVTLAVAATAVAVLGTVLIVGWITRPLPLLAAAARQVGQGNFNVQVEWKSRDEVGVLARAFNEMTIANSLLFTSLREEKAKLETLFLNTGEGIVWVGSEGRILFMNPAARRLLGFADRDPETLESALSGFTARPSLADIYASGGRFTPCEFHRPKPKLYILAGIAESLGGPEQPASFLFLFHDATIEKREEMLTRDFLSLVSHKLRTPLMVALGYLEILKAESENLSDFQKDSVDKIDAKDRELRRLVDKLIMFTTVQSPEAMVLHQDGVSLSDVIRQALEKAEPAVADPAARVSWDSKAFDRLPKVWADPRLAAEAAANLIENAVKFNLGAVKEVRIEARVDDGSVRLSVLDNGPGIPAEEHSKLFKKFYQLDQDFTGQVPGMGLGLAFVKNVIEAQGGRVGMRSEVGRGSEFFMALPIAPSKKA